jgi:hypothetical protein
MMDGLPKAEFVIVDGYPPTPLSETTGILFLPWTALFDLQGGVGIDDAHYSFSLRPHTSGAMAFRETVDISLES